jgi:peptidoglycan/LPS O-acetylase OafA/YrhL
MRKREVSYDLLRVIGILVIMIAHAYPPLWLFQLRNFGTPLLIITSALTHAYIYKERPLTILPFYKKRMSRLIFPAWIFLSFFFLLYIIFSKIIGGEYPFSRENILLSYTFYSGIGFVWIFKVYMILGLATPLALYLNKQISSGRSYYLLILFVYLLYELVLFLTRDSIPEDWKEPSQQLFSVIPYLLLFLYGMRLKALSDRRIVLISIISLLLFGVFGFALYQENHHFVQTNLYKYPPRFYYLAYSFFAIHLLYLLSRHYTHLLNPKIIIWLSNHALWIYLWHILGFYIWGNVFSIINIPFESQLFISFLKAIFMIGLSLSFTALQVRLVERYMIGSSLMIVRKLARHLH